MNEIVIQFVSRYIISKYHIPDKHCDIWCSNDAWNLIFECGTFTHKILFYFRRIYFIYSLLTLGQPQFEYSTWKNILIARSSESTSVNEILTALFVFSVELLCRTLSFNSDFPFSSWNGKKSVWVSVFKNYENFCYLL